MSNPLARDESGKPNLRTYENNGFLYGLPVGALIGVLIAGPHFYEWPVWESLAAIFGCAIGAGILGYIAVVSAYGSEAGGSNIVSSLDDERDSGGTAECSESSDSGSSCDSGGDSSGGD
jgi:hypothetical protein